MSQVISALEGRGRTGLFAPAGGVVALQRVAIEGTVHGGHARVLVRQVYVNREPRPIEAVYTFPLPSDAVLAGFAVICQGRRVAGVVKEREEAFRAYDEAITHGHGAALVDRERANVFTAQVGNLLPGEETVVELEYLQRMAAEEGTLRCTIPTLVAPRYTPGAPAGDRTGHGFMDPTDRVPDADRVTPPSGDARYTVSLDMTFDLGCTVAVESPSHALAVEDGPDHRLRVRIVGQDVSLDRDIVLVARSRSDDLLAAVVTDRREGAGTVAISVVPDLFEGATFTGRRDVVFVMDVSGSMAGDSMSEARAALRLCLRHLREGDRFNILPFSTAVTPYAPSLRPFTQQELQRADAFVSGLKAQGGTEMLAPVLAALDQAPDGIVVLLTDGQVTNEDEILAQAMRRRGRARIYTFGIGSAVSDALLGELARRTGGAMEHIHPGERLDQKVLTQFARAVAPRVDDLKVQVEGIEISEMAPDPAPALVDGEVWVLFGRYRDAGRGRLRLTGTRDGAPFELVIPVQLPEAADRPHLPRLWAGQRIRDLELARLEGRHAEAMEARIRKLALEHGLASRFTSLVVVEERQGDRLASGLPEARVIPVHLPVGWDLLRREAMERRKSLMSSRSGAGPPVARMAGAAPRPMHTYRDPAPFPPLVASELPAEDVVAISVAADLLGRQLASGLWDEPEDAGAPEADEPRMLRATALALLALDQERVTTAHPVHGAQVRKAIMALLALARRCGARHGALVELALAAAWLCATGQRTRGQIAAAAGGPAASSWLSGEAAARRRVDELRRGLSPQA
jgi:Ca-activated chloride channel family protein